MLSIHTDGTTTGGVNRTYPVWSWPLAQSAPLTMNASFLGGDSGFLGANLVSVGIYQKTTTSDPSLGALQSYYQGIYQWSSWGSNATPTAFSYTFPTKFYTAGNYWLAYDNTQTYGNVYHTASYSNTGNVIPLAIATDGSYVLQETDSFRITVYWQGNTTTILPVTSIDSITMTDGLLFYSSNNVLYLHDGPARVAVQYLDGTTRRAIRSVRLNNVPWIWYVHARQTDGVNVRSVLHPFNNATNGYQISTMAYSGAIRAVSNQIVVAWATDDQETRSSIQRQIFTSVEDMLSYPLVKLASVVGASSVVPSLGRW